MWRHIIRKEIYAIHIRVTIKYGYRKSLTEEMAHDSGPTNGTHVRSETLRMNVINKNIDRIV